MVVFSNGCGLETTEPLPEDYYSSGLRQFTVHADRPVTTGTGSPARVRSMTGFDASPLVAPQESLEGLYQRLGVRAARFPRGWDCVGTLDDVFPDRTADPGRDENYDLTGPGDLARILWSKGILPIWQAQHDVGAGSCLPTGTVGSGDTISDPNLWAAVVGRVAREINNRGQGIRGNQDFMRNLGELGLRPGYIEVLPDPLRESGYERLGINALLPVYSALLGELARVWQDVGDRRILGVIAPSIRVSVVEELNDGTKPVPMFLRHVAVTPEQAPDVLSIRTAAATPEQQSALLKATMEAADQAGLVDWKFADTGVGVSRLIWEDRADTLDSPARRSLFFAAFLTSVRILAQDLAVILVPDRWAGPLAPGDTTAGEDLFQQSDGRALPAMAAQMPFFLMELAGATRVQVDRVITADPGPDAVEATSLTTPPENPLAPREIQVLASRTGNGGMLILLSVLPLPADSRIGHRLTCDLDIQGLPVLEGNWTTRIGMIGETTGEFRFTESYRMPIPAAGTRIRRTVTVPSVHYLELTPPAS
jgi:hypothetical protein